MDIWATFPTVSDLLINNKYNHVETGVIQLNGMDRFDTREGAYRSVPSERTFVQRGPPQIKGWLTTCNSYKRL